MRHWRNKHRVKLSKLLPLVNVDISSHVEVNGHFDIVLNVLFYLFQEFIRYRTVGIWLWIDTNLQWNSAGSVKFFIIFLQLHYHLNVEKNK